MGFIAEIADRVYDGPDREHCARLFQASDATSASRSDCLSPPHLRTTLPRRSVAPQPCAPPAATKLPAAALRANEAGSAVMTFRVMPLVPMLLSVPLAAHAQVGGMPGSASGPPAPACQKLLELRDQTQQHGRALARADWAKPSFETC